MKKWTIPMLALMSVSALCGCGEIGDGTSGMYDKLKNFKLENIEDYKSIGFGAIEESDKKNKGRIKGTPRKEEQSESDFGEAYYADKNLNVFTSYTSPFYLIGQLDDGTVEALSFKSNNTALSIPLRGYVDLGKFALFEPEISPADYRAEDGSIKQRHELYYSTDINSRFLLSKSTGKIYNLTPTPNGLGESKILPFNCFTSWGQIAVIDNSWAMRETDQGLELKDLSSICGIATDRFGNILTATNEVLTISDTKLHSLASYFSEDMTFGYDDFTKLIYAISDQGKAYVFNESERFIETNGVGYYRYLNNSNGQRICLYDTSTYDLDVLNHWAYEHGYSNDLSFLSSLSEKDLINLVIALGEYRLNPKESACILTEEGYIAYTNHDSQIPRPEDITPHYDDDAFYKKGDRMYTCEGIIDRLSEYAYILEDSTTKGTPFVFYNTIIRGTSAYVFDSGIYKYSFLDDSVTKLDLDIYRATGMTISQDRRIEISGLCENLDTVKGYLDLNDQISFGEPKSKNIIVLTPMN